MFQDVPQKNSCIFLIGQNWARGESYNQVRLTSGKWKGTHRDSHPGTVQGDS